MTTGDDNNNDDINDGKYYDTNLNCLCSLLLFSTLATAAALTLAALTSAFNTVYVSDLSSSLALMLCRNCADWCFSLLRISSSGKSSHKILQRKNTNIQKVGQYENTAKYKISYRMFWKQTSQEAVNFSAECERKKIV